MRAIHRVGFTNVGARGLSFVRVFLLDLFFYNESAKNDTMKLFF